MVNLVLVLVATAASACGRIEFDARPDAAALDDAAPLPTCDWSAGPPFSGPAVRRTDLSTATSEVDPFLAPGDPLTMYLGSARDGSTDVFVATRPAIDQPFGPMTPVSELNTPAGLETGVILDRTSTTGYFTSAQQIHTVVRDVAGGPLRDAGPVTELAISSVYQDAWPSPDGLALTFSAGISPAQIYTASRTARSEPWGNVMLSPVNVPSFHSAGATLTADQRVIVWTTDVAGEFEIYYAVRAEPAGAFSAGRRLDEASAVGLLDFEPSLREDGCELFFSREVTSSDTDIFSLVATPGG